VNREFRDLGAEAEEAEVRKCGIGGIGVDAE
jgi:hypothetical protein